MSMFLENKVIVITGGAGLIGQEFAKTVMENGGIAIIADIDNDCGISLTNQLNKKKSLGKVNFQWLDINNKESILNLIDNLQSNYGKIDALINNAYPRNKNYGKKFEEVAYDDFCENVNINLGGYFLTSQQFLRFFKKQGYGNIINIASIYGIIAPRFNIYENTKMTMPVEYAVIKSGLLHLTKYMSKYFRGYNIRVNAISLGGILDAQPDSFLEEYKSYCLNKGMLDPQDINGTLLFLLSDSSLYINGQNIVVDDGFTL
jgi:NAD(P)-dependent dehydrogenase (short-subunit alcohol dehydrogenase family)